MTTTPRTDAEEQLCVRDGMQVFAVRSHFARKLEEELDEAKRLFAAERFNYIEQRKDLVHLQKNYHELGEAIVGEGVFVGHPLPYAAAKQLHELLKESEAGNVQYRAKIDKLEADIADLHAERENWRVSSVCRELQHSIELLRDDLITQAKELEEAKRERDCAIASEEAMAVTFNEGCAKMADLERWKTEQLAVEAQWDAQKVGALLGVPLGADIRPQIEPRVQELLNEIHDNYILIDQLRAALANYQ